MESPTHFIEKILPHGEVVLQDILVLIFPIELRRNTRYNRCDRCRVRHLYLMSMSEDELELVSTKSFREYEENISREGKGDLTHIDRQWQWSHSDGLIDHLHHLEEGSGRGDDKLGSRHGQFIHRSRGRIGGCG